MRSDLSTETSSENRSIGNALSAILTSVEVRRCIAGLLAVAALATLANVAVLHAGASAFRATGSLTSVNTSVLVGLLVGLLTSTSAAFRQNLADATAPLDARQLIGTRARAAGLVGLAAAVLFGVVVSGAALLLLSSRGITQPRPSAIVSYIEREAIAAARLAVIGVAIGVVCGDRRRAVGVAMGLLILDGVLESLLAPLQRWGPIGALNAFSDPTHHHQYSVAVGGLIALAWALLALIAATVQHESSRHIPRRR